MLALVGAMVQLVLHPKLSVWGGIASVVAGVVSAVLLTPIISQKYGLLPIYENALAYLLGLLGMQITGKVYHFARTISPAQIIERIGKLRR